MEPDGGGVMLAEIRLDKARLNFQQIGADSSSAAGIHQQVAGRHALRTLCLSAALSRPVRAARTAQTLDPAKRSQIGAHYTSRDDIETLLEPVMMSPLRREWDDVRTQAESLFEKVRE